jgi:hypothetical protein
VVEQRPVYEMLLDCLVYAPLGAAVVLLEEAPRLVQRGRDNLEKRVAVARLVGRFALDQARRNLVAPKTAVMSEKDHRSAEGSPPVSLAADSGPEASPETASGPQETADQHAVGLRARPRRGAAQGATEVNPTTGGPGQSTAASTRRAERPPGIAGRSSATPGTDLPIPAYDTLAASQVVERLASLTPAELESVRTHEAATRRRRTVLHRIAQLNTERDSATA